MHYILVFVHFKPYASTEATVLFVVWTRKALRLEQGLFETLLSKGKSIERTKYFSRHLSMPDLLHYYVKLQINAKGMLLPKCMAHVDDFNLSRTCVRSRNRRLTLYLFTSTRGKNLSIKKQEWHCTCIIIPYTLYLWIFLETTVKVWTGFILDHRRLR